MKCVYKIINTVDNKCYIGSTKDFKERVKAHKRGLKRGSHHNLNLQNAWVKYGEEAFIFTLVEECENYKEREDYYLTKSDIKNETYNIAESSRGGWNPENHPNGVEILKQRAALMKEYYSNLTKEEKSKIYGKFGKDHFMYKADVVKYCTDCREQTYYNGFKCKDCYLKLDNENKKVTKLEKQLIKRAKDREDLYSKGVINYSCKVVVIDEIEYPSVTTASKELGIPHTSLLRKLRSEKFNNYNFKIKAKEI